MISDETLLSDLDWKLPFKFHTDSYDKKLGVIISQNKKHVAFFSRILSKPQLNYTTNDKELLAIVECLKKSLGILLGYEINVFLDHKNLVYAATLSEYQRAMNWQLILEEFGPTIKHRDGVDNIVADTLSRFPSMPSKKYKSFTRKAQFHANDLFEFGSIEDNKYFSR